MDLSDILWWLVVLAAALRVFAGETGPTIPPSQDPGTN